ncbi:transposase family protein [Streptomyces yangpuensis]|uniref:transposase family protein n=1 Tax=Streptomyces yangpuensis TaxID=1648182 RepID=UPI003661B2AA
MTPTAPPAHRLAPILPQGLLDHLAQVPDPRDPRGVRYRLATLLSSGVCALTSACHNSRTAVAEWVRRCSPQELERIRLSLQPAHRTPPSPRRRHPRGLREGRPRRAYRGLRTPGRPDPPRGALAHPGRRAPARTASRAPSHHCRQPAAQAASHRDRRRRQTPAWHQATRREPGLRHPPRHPVIESDIRGTLQALVTD